MEIPTHANNAESKVEEFPVAVFIPMSSRMPTSCSVTVVEEVLHCEHKIERVALESLFSC